MTLGPPIRTESIYEGTIVNLRVSDYRRPDGAVVRREVMDHPGAVVMVPVEGDHVLLVRQPREAIERYTLELPAGKLDHPGEEPLDCARRELAEEVGKSRHGRRSRRTPEQAGRSSDVRQMDSRLNGLEGKDSSSQRGREHQSLMGSVFGAALAGIGEQIAKLCCKMRASRRSMDGCMLMTWYQWLT